MPLYTRNVFIDTEPFVKAGLDFSSKTIESFKWLCSEGELKNITSTIVVKELQRKISEQIREAVGGVSDFRRKAKALKSSNNQVVKNLFEELDEKLIEDEALQLFSDFLSASKAKVVDLRKVDANEVMNMYFERKPPFINEKKKNEFRDAFSLLAINSAIHEGEKVYVISADADHIAYCRENPKFISVDSLSKFLDIYNAHTDNRTQFIKGFLDEQVDEIKKEIKAQIESAEAYNDSGWEHSEVDGFSIEDVEDFDPEIVYIDDEECQVVFDVKVSYVVSVTGPDYANGTYDKEDGVTYTFDDATRVEHGDREFAVEVYISYEAGRGDFVNKDMQVSVKDISGGIDFCVEENSSDYYY